MPEEVGHRKTTFFFFFDLQFSVNVLILITTQNERCRLQCFQLIMTITTLMWQTV